MLGFGRLAKQDGSEKDTSNESIIEITQSEFMRRRTVVAPPTLQADATTVPAAPSDARQNISKPWPYLARKQEDRNSGDLTCAAPPTGPVLTGAVITPLTRPQSAAAAAHHLQLHNYFPARLAAILLLGLFVFC